MGLALGGAAAPAGCIDPPLAPVNVTVSNLRRAIGDPSAFTGQRQITLTLCFVPAAGSDAGISPPPPLDAGRGPTDDAGRLVGECLPGEIRRGVYFDQTDQFRFTVQVDALAYRAVRVAAVVSLMCTGGSMAVGFAQIAAGTSGAFVATRDRPTDVTVTMASERLSPCR